MTPTSIKPTQPHSWIAQCRQCTRYCGTAGGCRSGWGLAPRDDQMGGVVLRSLLIPLGVPVAIVAISLAMSPRDYVATGHCWLNVHTDAIWAFVGPVLFVLTVSGEAQGSCRGGTGRGRGSPFCALTPDLQANTCILVRVVIVTVSSARCRARMLSPQPCMQQQLRIQMW